MLGMVRKKLAMNHGELVIAQDMESDGCNRKEAVIRMVSMS